MPVEALRATYEIILCFVPRDGVSCHGLHVDARTVLGPWVHVGNDETMVRMLRYVGATQEQIAEYEDRRRRWGQGSVHITVIGANRKNLLRLDWRKLEK
jgi:uncharacterized protein (DUF2126 family)